jgi:hypothetical protein
MFLRQLGATITVAGSEGAGTIATVRLPLLRLLASTGSK